MIINITTFDLLLRDRGMTQAALAQRARLGTKTIGRIRRGEELRVTNAEKIAIAFGVSLDELQLPPSETLQERAGKKSGLNRLVADLSSKALNNLTLTSRRYKISENSILEAGPYMFTILAELSLMRRRKKLEAWKDASLAAVESGPRNHRPYTIEGIEEDIWELYEKERLSIEERDLSGGFADTHPKSPTKENPGHDFIATLEDIAAECGHSLDCEGSTTEDFDPVVYDVFSEAAQEFLDPEGEYLEYFILPYENAFLDILSGQVPLRDMPEELLASGSGPDRCAWVAGHPSFQAYWSGADNTDECTAAEQSPFENDAGNGGSNA